MPHNVFLQVWVSVLCIPYFWRSFLDVCVVASCIQTTVSHLGRWFFSKCTNWIQLEKMQTQRDGFAPFVMDHDETPLEFRHLFTSEGRSFFAGHAVAVVVAALQSDTSSFYPHCELLSLLDVRSSCSLVPPSHPKGWSVKPPVTGGTLHVLSWFQLICPYVSVDSLPFCHSRLQLNFVRPCHEFTMNPPATALGAVVWGEAEPGHCSVALSRGPDCPGIKCLACELGHCLMNGCPWLLDDVDECWSITLDSVG